MTTIAYKDGVMAADTQETTGDVFNRAPKLVRLSCGGVAGASGESVMCQRALNWLAAPKKGGKAPKLVDCTVLVAYADGRKGVYQDKLWTLLPFHDCMAIGSGSQAALGAMNRYKASAIEAVECAAAVDPSTSLPVEALAVEPKRAKRKR